jgi:hypothetical protein
MRSNGTVNAVIPRGEIVQLPYAAPVFSCFFAKKTGPPYQPVGVFGLGSFRQNGRRRLRGRDAYIVFAAATS